MGKRPLTLQAYRTLMTAAAPVAPLLLAWRARHGKEDLSRRNERLGRPAMERPAGPLIWFHAASVGETNAVLPLIVAMRDQRPDIAILLTTGTVTSARLATVRMPADVIHQYVPLDSPPFASHFLDHWRPEIAIFAESEIWPSLIEATARRDIALLLVNARLSERSFNRWRRRPGAARALFGRFDHVLAQNDTYAERFAQLGAPMVTAVGNLKIDAPPPPADETLLSALKKGTAGRPLFLAASTHPGEEQIITEVHGRLAKSHPGLLTIIGPRHPHRGHEIAKIVRSAGLRPALRSAKDSLNGSADIYIADTIGELGLFYALAPVAFIGGSLVHHGGQNPIEAVKHGTAILSGPHVKNFDDAFDVLKRAGGCEEISSAAELAERTDALMRDTSARKQMLKQGEAAVSSMSGALNKSFEALSDLLPQSQGTKRGA